MYRCDRDLLLKKFTGWIVSDGRNYNLTARVLSMKVDDAFRWLWACRYLETILTGRRQNGVYCPKGVGNALSSIPRTASC